MFVAQFKAKASPASEIAFFVEFAGFTRLENLLMLLLPYQKDCGNPALNNLLPQSPFGHRVNIIRAIVDDALPQDIRDWQKTNHRCGVTALNG